MGVHLVAPVFDFHGWEGEDGDGLFQGLLLCVHAGGEGVDLALLLHGHLGVLQKLFGQGHGLLGRGGGCSKIRIDKLSLYAPRQIVGERLYQHEVAGFGDESQTVRRGDPVLGKCFVRFSDEIIFSKKEAVFVFIEPLSCSSLRSLVNGVDLLKSYDSLAAVLLDRYRTARDLNNAVFGHKNSSITQCVAKNV